MSELRTAIVTGASRGIGAACARRLARDGARVLLAARSESELEQVASELPNAPVVHCVDLSVAGAAEELAAVALDRLGYIDVLVNNAGVSGAVPAHRIDDATFDRIFAVNVRSLLLLSARAAESMARSGGGAIVNISSAAALTGLFGMAAYAASKAAVTGMTRSLACEWGPSGVRVNAVAPGLIITDMWERGRARPGLADSLESHISLRRWGRADDVADVVGFLASDAARYVTGETLLVDGGFAAMTDVMPRAQPLPGSPAR